MSDKPTVILAMDTATEACSVALQVDDQLYHHKVVIPRLHAQQLLGFIQELIDKAGLQLNDLSLVAYGKGPGAFTGVRIAASVCQGLTYGLNIHAIGVSNLALIAQQTHRVMGLNVCLVAMDARMEEVYAGFFEVRSGLMHVVGQECVLPPSSIEKVIPSHQQVIDIKGVGTGWSQYPNTISQNIACIDASILPDALDLLPFAKAALENKTWSTAADLTIEYLRHPISSTS